MRVGNNDLLIILDQLTSHNPYLLGAIIANEDGALLAGLSIKGDKSFFDELLHTIKSYQLNSKELVKTCNMQAVFASTISTPKGHIIIHNIDSHRYIFSWMEIEGTPGLLFIDIQRLCHKMASSSRIIKSN